ncbi:secretion protein HlyD [Phyllobacterium sp. SB3]|uniref:secretion protein HlyD n=1 Tax=Phyllobacterium sp. SB3 TaxID=3156073 RepID=UPI0032AEFF4B
MKRLVVTCVALLLFATGLIWWFDVPNKMGWVESKSTRLTLYGNVDIRQVPLGFRVNGRIEKVWFDEGDKVAAGSVIASLDATTYRQSVDAAIAEVSALRATLDKAVAGPRQTEIAQAEASLNERLADLENVTLAYERALRLRPNGTISQSGLDEAIATKSIANARTASAREALALLKEGTRKEDIETAKANLAAAEAKLSSARTALEDTQLRAPNDGIILSRVREPGSIVAPSDPVSVLSLLKPVWVRSYISEMELGRIHPGMVVDVYSDTNSDKPVKGKIGFISPVAEFTPKSVETPELRTDLVYRLRVIVDDTTSGLRQGMPVTLRLPMEAGQKP